MSSRNIQLSLQYVESQGNKAGAPSRRLSRSDSKLSDDVFVTVAFGGKTGRSFDPMALDANAMRGKMVCLFRSSLLFRVHVLRM